VRKSELRPVGASFIAGRCRPGSQPRQPLGGLSGVFLEALAAALVTSKIDFVSDRSIVNQPTKQPALNGGSS
jgi:hypothetical protein